MYTIEKEEKNEIIIKNSQFISLIYKVYSKEQINKYLQEAKLNYPEATHYCYAYKIDDQVKSNDDGEPSGTAGLPILEVINKQELNYTLIIVIRYFGGIKLGAGGLLRAYSKSASNVLKLCQLNELKQGKQLTISFNYDLVKQINYLLKDEIIINKYYDELITYEFKTANDQIINKISNMPNIKTITSKDIYIENKAD